MEFIKRFFRTNQKSTTEETIYKITLSKRLDDELTYLTVKLKKPKSEVMRRAFTLYKLAVDADKVILVTNGEEQEVLVK